MSTKVFSNLRLADDVKAYFGSDDDGSVYVNGGNLYIDQDTNDKDIIFRCDDGSGGTGTYLTLDGSATTVNFGKSTYQGDNVYSYYGNNYDLRIHHDGTDTFFHNDTGDLKFQQDANDKDIIFQADDGSGGITAYITLDGSATTTIFSKQTTFNNTVVMGSQLLKFADNGKANFGDSNDLQIYHDGSHNYIDAVTGDQDIIFKGTDSSSDITALTLDMSDAGTAIFNHDIKIADDGIIKVGNDTDLYITHDASNSHIVNGTGDFKITQNANDKDIIFNCDDGSGGNTAYLTLDGGDEIMQAAVSMKFADSKSAYFGGSSDLQIVHDGSNSYVSHIGTGDLYIKNTTDDKDIIFQCDDGSGGVETYFYLDGSVGGGTPYTVFPDNARLSFGNPGDGTFMELFHDGTNSYIENESGHLYIANNADDSDIIFQCDDGSGGTTAYITLDGSIATTTMHRKVNFNDNGIFANNTELRWKDSGGTERTILELTNANDLYFGGSFSGSMIFVGGGAYTERMRIDDSGGVLLSSTLTVGVDDTGYDVKFFGATSGRYMLWDESADALKLQDTTIASFGTGDDFYISHNGSYTSLMEQTSDLYISNSADDKDIIFRSDDGAGGLATYFSLDGSAAEHDGSATTVLFTKFPDKSTASFGNSNDLRLYHDGSNSQIFNYNGHLYIKNHSDDSDIIFECDDGSGSLTAYLTLDGSAANTVVHTDFLIPAQKKLRDSSNSNKYIELSDSSANIVYSAYAKHVWKTYDGSAYGERMSLTNTGELEAPRRKFAKTSNTDGDHDGDVVYFGGTTSMTTGAIYHYKSDGTWELADADAASTCDGLLGVALGAASDTNGVLLRGMVTLDHDPGAVGDVLFLSTTAGDCSATAPSGNGDIVRVIGYCIDASNGQIWFNPDGTFVEVTA